MKTIDVLGGFGPQATMETELSLVLQADADDLDLINPAQLLAEAAIYRPNLP